MGGLVKDPLSFYSIRIVDLSFPLTAADEEGIRSEAMTRSASVRLSLTSTALSQPRLLRQSVDARKKHDIRLICSVSFRMQASKRQFDRISLLAGVEAIPESGSASWTAAPAGISPPTCFSGIREGPPPVVVGAGPAGLFAALLLARAGWNPIIIERGPKIRERTARVASQWHRGVSEPECNVQFGEGGAGAFSDGKLTTRIHDPRCSAVLAEFVAAGAPEEILYKAKPHIGTDRLLDVVEHLRKAIEAEGGIFRFETRFEEPILRQGRIHGVVLTDVRSGLKEEIPTGPLILALGHSARDTYENLFRLGVAMEAKPFSIGARIEHFQESVDISQYGPSAGHPALGPGEYQFHESIGGRTVYTFCMCPGGTVVACATEPETIVVNGMSRFRRDGMNANSALVVSITPEDFDGKDPLSGIRFQRRWEQAAFRAGRGAAPVQRVGDLLGRPIVGNRVEPSYTGPTFEADLQECLPGYVIEGMKSGILAFERKMNGFASTGALLTGIETRTSSPLRVLRGETMESISHPGLFPCGEGAGYAGGIMSAAVDGLRVAESVLDRHICYNPSGIHFGK